MRSRLDRSKLTDTCDSGGTPKHCNARNARRYLLEQFNPFAAQAILEIGEAGGITAWASHAFHPTGANWISNIHHYDRNAARRLQQKCRRLAAGYYEHVRR